MKVPLKTGEAYADKYCVIGFGANGCASNCGYGCSAWFSNDVNDQPIQQVCI